MLFSKYLKFQLIYGTFHKMKLLQLGKNVSENGRGNFCHHLCFYGFGNMQGPGTLRIRDL